MHSSPGTYELFKTQAAEAADELRQAEEALAALGRSDNLLNLDTQKQDALEAVSHLSKQLDALAAEIREQSTRAKVADMQMASVPERVPTQRRNVPNQYSVERLHTLLVELNNKRTEAADQVQRRRPAGGRARPADRRHDRGDGTRPGHQRQRGVHRRQPGLAGAGQPNG